MATLAWRNTTTGQTGEKTLAVHGPTITTGPAHPYDAIVTTGAGTVGVHVKA